MCRGFFAVEAGHTASKLATKAQVDSEDGMLWPPVNQI